MTTVNNTSSVGNSILSSMTQNVSGALDIPLLVESLLFAETGIEINGVTRKLDSLAAKKDAFDLLSQGLSGFQEIMDDFRTAFASGEKQAVLSDPSVATVEMDSSVANGSYSLEVLSLALKQSVSLGGFSAPSATVGSGTITIENGSRSTGAFVGSGGATNLTVAPGTTVQGLVDQINGSSAGVTAYLVQNGNGYDVAISSKETGESNGFAITVADDDGNNIDAVGLSSFQYNDGNQNMALTQVGSDAKVKFDGVMLSSTTNSFDNVIEGVSINATKVNMGSPTIVTVTDNTGEAKQLLEDFVGTYNDMVEVLEYLGGEEEGPDSMGALFRDSDLRLIEKNLKATMAQYVSGYGGDALLNDIGVRFTDVGDGTIELDEDLFNAALIRDPESVAKALGQTGTVTDPRVKFLSAGDDTVQGTYSPIDITNLPKSAVLAGGAAEVIAIPAAGVTVDGTNDTFSVTVNGVSTGDLNLTNKTYADYDEMALEMQAQINGAQGTSVIVTFDGSGFSIDSDVLGSASVVSLDSADAGFETTTGFAVGSSAAGEDIVGSIGGNLAIGVGNVLEGILGDSQGMKLEINTDVLGNYGDVTISDGVGKTFFDQISDMYELDGAYTSTLLRVEDSIEEKEAQKLKLEEKTELLRIKYSIRYSALNSMIIAFDSTAKQLELQFDAWAKG